ncbi:carboxylating nicotinate-nucleotide diphosphorylase [Corynebacterium jeddahense]|uniref:nicotinate-nucleotide diphosphorylase (carboxylating) n=3 Tax=Corynebacterium jeddahense TaxID=1414719 RepID=A0ABY7UIF5_9CORY|nr:carboxylating nicotinate-nucleotide diphosphorylase [Corynebacterium jeddahense]WCZ38435.1 Nicotinate-nucleotide pyrophosphorylase [carboxylating] [Corynebacterium jeddahense]
MDPLRKENVLPLIRMGLEEDFRDGPDVTATSTLDPDQTMTAHFTARQHGTVAGLQIIEWTMHELNPDIKITFTAADGDRVEPGTRLATVEGNAIDIVGAERTALNLLTYASGIATRTRQWADAIADTNAKVRDTRKTLPGYRALAKYAVRAGGGVNHRMSLSDAALIKDNHIAAAGGAAIAYRRVRDRFPAVPVETEVDTFEQLEEMLQLKPDLIMVDNFSPEGVRGAVEKRDALSPETKLEASGGLTLENAGEYAETGVDYIAVGELTHSVRVLDIGLDA